MFGNSNEMIPPQISGGVASQPGAMAAGSDDSGTDTEASMADGLELPSNRLAQLRNMTFTLDGNGLHQDRESHAQIVVQLRG